MANIRKLQEITSADATAVELDAIDLPINVPLDYFITVDSGNSGTIQFQIAKKGSVPDWSNIKAWPAGSNVPPITARSGDQNLWYKASAAAQKFTTGY